MEEGRLLLPVWRLPLDGRARLALLPGQDRGHLPLERREREHLGGGGRHHQGDQHELLSTTIHIAKVLGHTSAVVYGVEVPGAEGKAGMAAILQKEEGDKVDLDLLASGLRKALPSYARPMFVR